MNHHAEDYVLIIERLMHYSKKLKGQIKELAAYLSIHYQIYTAYRDNICCTFGGSSRILTDNGTEFKS